MMAFIPAIRPDRTLVWVPEKMARRLKIEKDAVLTETQWSASELQMLISSRLAANEDKKTCDERWHRDNGYE